MILGIYALCAIMIYIRSLGGFLLTWVIATFASLGQCNNGASALATIALSTFLMWIASVAMGVNK